MKRFVALVLVSLISIFAFIRVAAPQPVLADACATQHADLNLCPLPHGNTDNGDLVKTALQFFFNVLGGVSLLIIVLAGFRYVISRGDPAGMAKAKNTILYALIGLGVAISAQLIVAFVINRIG